MPRMLAGRMLGMEKTMIRRINDLADPSCINLGIGELRFPTPKAVLGHVRENVDSWHLGYSPNEGFSELRELIAARAGEGVSAHSTFFTASVTTKTRALLASSSTGITKKPCLSLL